MEAPRPINPLFEVGAEYQRLHQLAIQCMPSVEIHDGECAVAILLPNKSTASPKSEDFFWLKVREKHYVAKLRKTYRDKYSTDVSFRFADNLLSDAVQLRQLNNLGNIVVFTAHECPEILPLNPPNTAGVSSTPSRAPIQRASPQLPASASAAPMANTKVTVKTELSENQYKAPTVSGIPSWNGVPFLSLSPTPPHSYSHSRDGVGQFTAADSDRHTASEHVNGNVRIQVSKQENDSVKGEFEEEDFPHPDEARHQCPGNSRLQALLQTGSPDALEAEVRKTQVFLETLKDPMMERISAHKDALHWVEQIDMLQKHEVNTPTIIGVVGNTGAGKSSVINAMLDEERLVPTNCMRACTAVVTQISWNDSSADGERYRAAIEFISANEWEKDLRVLLTDLVAGDGTVARDATINSDSDAGIAYAKIKAVYPGKTKEQLAASSVGELMSEPAVKDVLGTIKNIKNARPEQFYKDLQFYVDSKEKSTAGKKKKKEKEKQVVQMEYWPLIRVVKIYTKAEALSTGAIVVDLPGVHDSNAARAAVAARYLKQCTGLWIVAPISRAVDDKSAKTLLGESFKRQLKYDGTYSRVTFICSKTDDISIVEAADSLGLDEDMAADWDKMDVINKELSDMKESLKELQESRAVYADVMNDAEDALEVWEKLKDELEDGKEVFAPSESNKRKRSASPKASRKRSKTSKASSEEGDDFIDDADEEAEDDEESDDETSSEAEPDKGDPLTMEAIEEKITQLRENKKHARRERVEIDGKAKTLREEMKALENQKLELEAAMSSICINGRNKYSKGAIQTDFAAGIKELDQENSQEEDEENFNPDLDIRDYEEVARSLPVFCVSSRAYQKLSGRAQREANVPGFKALEDTEIPLLQAHCKNLTEAGRAANCRRFLTELSQLLTSLSLWASNDGTGVKLTDEQLAADTRFLKTRLKNLEKNLERAVQETLNEMKTTLAEQIYENFEIVVQRAADQATSTAHRWGDRQNGGYYWSTYKALCRRDGVFTNGTGLHDLNLELTEPIIKGLASNWERAFARRLPQVVQSFAKKAKTHLSAFHREVQALSMRTGTGVAGLAMLAHQLNNYEGIFTNLTAQLIEVINELQREANREFTPIIAANLASSYEWCAAEVGPGQYARMKAHMNAHVEDRRHEMFKDATEAVKSKLTTMCRTVEEIMANKADEVFVKMTRDYIQVISGTHLPNGEVMPKWERKMRSDVARLIEDYENDVSGSEKEIIEPANADSFDANDAAVKTEATSARANVDNSTTLAEQTVSKKNAVTPRIKPEPCLKTGGLDENLNWESNKMDVEGSPLN